VDVLSDFYCIAKCVVITDYVTVMLEIYSQRLMLYPKKAAFNLENMKKV